MTEISSVSGLKGVREALWMELLEASKCIRHWHDTGEDGMIVSKTHVFKLWEARDKLLAALSLPPSPQAPDNRDFQRAEGLYLKLSEPLMEPKTPVIIERVNGDCSVSQFIIARDEAHGLIEQMREFLHVAAAPSAGSGQEGLRETLRDIRCVADTLYMNLKSAAIWNPDSFHKESLEQLFRRFKDAITRVVKLEAALLPPAPKPPDEHVINPVTDRCVICGKNGFNRHMEPVCSRAASLERESK